MASIELVIKIPEGLKKDFESEQWTALSCMEMKDVLINGTPLPKGHGRLIDADKLDVGGLYDEDGHLVGYKYVTKNDLSYVPTIIDADKESGNGKV